MRLAVMSDVHGNLPALEEGGALARSFLPSIETGQNVAGDFLSHAYGLAALAGFADYHAVPEATFDWEKSRRI
jgi:hypothetical protein